MRALFLAPIALAAACGAPADLQSATNTSSAATSCEGSCPDQVSNLIAGQHIDAGDVRITNDDTNLYVEISTQDGWLLTETHIFAGTGEIPVNRKGTPVPGRFPFHGSFSPGVTSYTEVIPLAGLDVGCGEELKVAVHAVVKKQVGGGWEEQTAWGDGDAFNTPRWSFFTLYSICCDPPPPPDCGCHDECIPDAPPPPDCRESSDYWAAQESWPANSPADVLCWSESTGALTMGQLMASDASGSLFLLLAQEQIAALQNQQCLAYDWIIGPAMVETSYITNDCSVSSAEEARAQELLELLAKYNDETYEGPWHYTP